jgi:hypothetical protein
MAFYLLVMGIRDFELLDVNGFLSFDTQPSMFSRLPMKSLHCNSRSVGAQFFTAMVMCPDWSGEAR